MKKIPRMTAAVLLIALLLSLAGCGASDGKTHLTFQIWDDNQREGMEAMCSAYTAQHPDVVIDVQVVSWNEYWTKLEAAAESSTLPDIFWMHTNQLLYYADFGMLADVTDLYNDVEAGYYQNHFSDISMSNVSVSNGRYYGVPKDKDNGVLKYFGTEEAQIIQGNSGAAIPAYLGTEETWRTAFDGFSYQLDLDCIFEQFDYAIQVPYNSASPRWKSQVLDVLTQIYAGNQEIDSGLDRMASIVNQETAKKLADN